MGKDFRVGLITGVVLAVAALIWVATRPSLSPQANVAANAPGSPPQNAAENPLSGAGSEQAPAAPVSWQDLPAAADRAWRAQAGRETPAGPSNPVEAQTPQGTRVVNESVAPQPAPEANLPDLTVYEQSERIKTTRFHIVQKGETLSGIAQQYYGSAGQWRKIVAANDKTIKDPNKIAPGTKLTIPD